MKVYAGSHILFNYRLGGIGVAYNNYMNPYGYNNNMYSDPDADEGKVFRIWKSRYVS